MGLRELKGKLYEMELEASGEIYYLYINFEGQEVCVLREINVSAPKEES